MGAGVVLGRGLVEQPVPHRHRSTGIAKGRDRLDREQPEGGRPAGAQADIDQALGVTASGTVGCAVDYSTRIDMRASPAGTAGKAVPLGPDLVYLAAVLAESVLGLGTRFMGQEIVRVGVEAVSAAGAVYSLDPEMVQTASLQPSG